MNNSNTKFELWPAIDLMDGNPVRLTQGDFSQKKEYAVSLESIIQQFEIFATGIHVIDLEGARSGKIKNEAVIKKIISCRSLPLQLGGGIRSVDAMENWISEGASRVIVGSKALTDSNFFNRCIDDFITEKIIISIDVKEEKVMINGWEKESNRTIYEFLESLLKKGFKKFMVTDIRKDGTLKGPSLNLYKELRKRFPEIYLLAAGGVGTIDDLRLLRTVGCNGAIFGKSFYEGMISLQELNQFKNAC